MKSKIRRYQIESEDLYLRVYLLVKNHGRRWQSVAAVAALGGGFLSPLVGTLLDLSAWLARAGYQRLPLTKASAAFYIMTFPLLAFGSHCLDLLENDAPASQENLLPKELDFGVKT